MILGYGTKNKKKHISTFNDKGLSSDTKYKFYVFVWHFVGNKKL